MDAVEGMIENFISIIIVIIGLTVFISMYDDNLSAAKGINSGLQDMGVVVEVTNYSSTEQVYTREDVIGALIDDKGYNLVINGTLFDKAIFDLDTFNIWSIQVGNYRKEIKYNVDGTVQYIIFTKII